MVEKSFKCIKRRKEKGINWCDETRIYSFTPTFFSRFYKTSGGFKIDNIGEFYFAENKKSLPMEFNINESWMLEPSKGKKIFEWVKENSSGKVLIYCRRDYGFELGCGSHEGFYMTVAFSSDEDAMAFKLRWM